MTDFLDSFALQFMLVMYTGLMTVGLAGAMCIIGVPRKVSITVAMVLPVTLWSVAQVYLLVLS